MDKNTIIGFALIALVLIGFSVYSQPSDKEKAEMARQDSIANVTKQKMEAAQKKTATMKQEAAKEEATMDTTALFHAAMQGKAQKIILKNSKIELTFNTKGATVEKAVIKGFKDREGHHDVTLFDGNDQKLSYTFVAKEQNISTQDLYFTPSEITDSTVTFTADAGEGKNIIIRYGIDKSYLLHQKMQVNGMAGLFAPNTKTMAVDWTDKCRQQEK